MADRPHRIAKLRSQLERAVPCPPSDGPVPWRERCLANVGEAE